MPWPSVFQRTNGEIGKEGRGPNICCKDFLNAQIVVMHARDGNRESFAQDFRKRCIWTFANCEMTLKKQGDLG